MPTGRWKGEADLAPVRSRISGLDSESGPEVVREVHAELLEAFGRSIGFGFRDQRPGEAPAKNLISVFGRFDSGAREREFGLQLVTEALDDGRFGRVAWLIDFYMPGGSRGQGAGTALMGDLLELWERVGVGEVRLTATADGYPAYISWGFSVGSQGLEDDGLTPMRIRLPRDGHAKERWTSLLIADD